nr:EthD family reductase [uncultured Rhodopila sp.]
MIYQLQPGQKLDVDYYLKTHIPLVQARFGPLGMKGAQVLHGTGSPAGPAPAILITLLDFESLQAFQTAIETHGAEVMGDVANFTDTQPSIQFNLNPAVGAVWHRRVGEQFNPW